MTRIDYKPNITLSLLHEHKRAYQPNLLKAMGLVSALAFVVAMSFSLVVDEVKSTQSIEEIRTADEFPRGDNRRGIGRHEPEAGVVDMRPPSYREHAGFAGFDGYIVSRADRAIAPEHPESVQEILIETNPYIDLGPPISHAPDAESYSSFTGEGCEDGLPEPSTFFDMRFPSSSDRLWNLPGIAKGTIRGRRSDRVPVLSLAKVKYPRLGMYVDGKVVLSILTDEEGHMQECEVILEEPKKCDFAKVLLTAVKKSVFYPPVVNGEKKAYRFRLTYEFCWDCPVETTVKVVSGDMVVSGPIAR